MTMSKEKQIEIKVVTYKEERLNYFTALYEKAKNKFDRLFKKHKDAPYLSDEFQKMSDAGHEAEFLGDVVKMLKQSEGEWEWFEEWSPSTTEHPRECDECGWRCGKCKTALADVVGGYWDDAWEKPNLNFCPNCGAKMKGGGE